MSSPRARTALPASALSSQKSIPSSHVFFSTLYPDSDVRSTSSRRSPSRLVTVPKTLCQKPKSQSSGEKQEIFTWLSEGNPKPVDLLHRVSLTSTPYAKLIKLTCDELAHSLGHVRSERLDELDRESSLSCARVEVEIQRQRERIVRLRHDKQEIQEELNKYEADLRELGFAIDRLHQLAQVHGLAGDKQDRKSEELPAYVDLSRKQAAFDQDMYRALWQEQQELLDQLQALESHLAATQKQQVVEMKAWTLRRYPHLAPVEAAG